ncbi:MAG TPA: hypothetical protein VFQ88_10385 [Nevskiaceae bacterium]|nr:hypothetical protein [Nevskiaceae bacterium]
MAAKSTKKSKEKPAATEEEYDDPEDADFESDEPDLEVPDATAADPSALRSRDWRDVEKYREQRELRKLVDDDFDDFDADDGRSEHHAPRERDNKST